MTAAPLNFGWPDWGGFLPLRVILMTTDRLFLVTQGTKSNVPALLLEISGTHVLLTFEETAVFAHGDAATCRHQHGWSVPPGRQYYFLQITPDDEASCADGLAARRFLP
ncbi:hypothetical protein MKK75_02595 [Methylobacterium sp. J-030]|uniref:hypothetical protein n=1 Tax=Methylobacterium sp. J-030 TaxID=2836627 RepID=UPI001FBA9EC2|nr:hypothetical protein [Methylobacterium sp. J-030]MCJ2067702.1 hypothetical protein [Methylobacterium sp. J-030]